LPRLEGTGQIHISHLDREHVTRREILPGMRLDVSFDFTQHLLQDPAGIHQNIPHVREFFRRDNLSAQFRFRCRPDTTNRGQLAHKNEQGSFPFGR
jgi:hypothetical protein